MKKILLISALTLAATTAYADNTDTTTLSASGTVIADLVVTAVDTMVMPDLVAPGATETPTSVKLECDMNGAITIAYTGNGNPFAHGTANAAAVDTSSVNALSAIGNSTGTCATATVSGEANYNFTITTSDPSAASTTLAMTALTCNGITTLDGSGASTLYCGATVTASAGVATGAYTANDGTVTVTYD